MTNTTLAFGPDYTEIEVGKIQILAEDTPLTLDSGAEIRHFPMAYQMHGTLNKDKSNAVLICHGLTGDQYVIDDQPVTGKPGWWKDMVGPGKAIDTKKFCVICPNVLGGCMGSYGPKSINPETGTPFNLEFPVVTIRDMVNAQKLLLEALGIDTLFAVVGGSMGGMQALQWAASYPKQVNAAIVLAAAARHSPQNIAFHEIGRQAIMADPEWCDGNYIEEQRFPAKGLAVARMTAHVTYLSESALQRKFGRELQEREKISYGFEADFQVESYLRYQGNNFVARFDPNSYLYITRALDYFDLAAEFGGDLAQAFRECDAAFCIVSFTSDWLFPTEEAREVVHALAGSASDVSFVEIESDKGHDAFLLDEPELARTIEGFMHKMEKRIGV